MKADDFLDQFITKSREYTTLNGIEIVDDKGNPIERIIFDIKNNKIILSSNK